METSEKHISEIDEELYGALLSANERIKGAGGNLVIISMIVGILFSFAVQLQWFEQFFDVDLSRIRHWSVYLVNAVICFFLGGILCDIFEKSAYRKYKQDIFYLARRADLSKYQLVANIAGDEDLTNIAEWLKKDTSGDKLHESV